jgi:hypothetical protein
MNSKFKNMECQKDKSPGIGQCCCNCANHLKDFHHPLTTGESCLKQRGWICFLDMRDTNESNYSLHSDWSEHGLCECWLPQKEKGE